MRWCTDAVSTKAVIFCNRGGCAKGSGIGDNSDRKRNITLRAAFRLKQVLYLSAGRLELYSVEQKGGSLQN